MGNLAGLPTCCMRLSASQRPNKVHPVVSVGIKIDTELKLSEELPHQVAFAGRHCLPPVCYGHGLTGSRRGARILSAHRRAPVRALARHRRSGGARPRQGYGYLSSLGDRVALRFPFSLRFGTPEITRAQRRGSEIGCQTD
jgi:hypothetical protein